MKVRLKNLISGAGRLFVVALCGRGTAAPSQGAVTFDKDIAPIVYRNCCTCHRSGESTPFNLLTYNDVAKRAKQIAEVTRLRYMPPWPPDVGGGYPRLIGERRLSDGDLELIQRWASGGAIEGDPTDLPPAPEASSEWQLGPPDLVVEMDKSYNLPAQGKDVYRNFAISVPGTVRRYVRAIEFRPQSSAVHHVFIETDRSRQSRLQATSGAEPGFPGLAVPGASKPPGQFLTWQPGKRASISPPGMPWTLEPGTDLVIEAHLRPTGKIEPIRFKVGLYFTNQPPERTALNVLLTSLMIDIPTGATNFPVESSFTLPVDCEALGVLAHCHFLGREVEGHADLPGGSRIPLLLITNWDFNWQGDYRYQTPVEIPRGAILRMRFTYDNSTNNPRNPNNPPKRVRYGPQATDEMAELSFLMLPKRVEDEKVLKDAFAGLVEERMEEYDLAQVRENPEDAQARLNLGNVWFAQRRFTDAKKQIERAIELDPNLAEAHYYAGLIARMENRLPDAEREFQSATRLDPTSGKTWGNLGLVQIGRNNLKGARESMQHALEIDPTDGIARSMLDKLPK